MPCDVPAREDRISKIKNKQLRNGKIKGRDDTVYCEQICLCWIGHSIFVLSGVCPLNNFHLWVLFNNGEAKINCKLSFVLIPAFVSFSNMKRSRIYIDYGIPISPVWNEGDIDISP